MIEEFIAKMKWKPCQDGGGGLLYMIHEPCFEVVFQVIGLLNENIKTETSTF